MNQSTSFTPPTGPSPESITDDSKLGDLHERFLRMRGEVQHAPDATVIIPVNAQGHLQTVREVLEDLSQYGGGHRLEVILVINNYPPEAPPVEIGQFRQLGLTVVALPSVLQVKDKSRIPAIIGARGYGARAAHSPVTIHFDADCRLPDPTAVIDWYVDVLRSGAQLAYTHVDYHSLHDSMSMWTRLAIHHAIRWAKRTMWRIPTARGGNYAIDRTLLLKLIDAGILYDDLLVGWAVHKLGGRIVYSGQKRRRVLTSGQHLRPGWIKLLRYNRYRLRYTLSLYRSRSESVEYLKDQASEDAELEVYAETADSSRVTSHQSGPLDDVLASTTGDRTV